MRKNNKLDERQEQELLGIEHNGYRLAFWGLLVVIVLESFVFQFEFKTILGEWSIFMILCIYSFSASMKKGIWDRKLEPNFRTNLIISVIASVICGVLMTVGVWARYPGKPFGCIAAGIMTAVFLFILLITALSLAARRFRKKLAEQEREDEEDM